MQPHELSWWGECHKHGEIRQRICRSKRASNTDDESSQNERAAEDTSRRAVAPSAWQDRATGSEARLAIIIVSDEQYPETDRGRADKNGPPARMTLRWLDVHGRRRTHDTRWGLDEQRLRYPKNLGDSDLAISAVAWDAHARDVVVIATQHDDQIVDGRLDRERQIAPRQRGATHGELFARALDQERVERLFDRSIIRSGDGCVADEERNDESQ